jgi:hypothetical protein
MTGQQDAPTPARTRTEMRPPQTSAAAEARTVPLRDSDAPERVRSARLALGRYRLERRLGAGAFGVVWLAWDEKLEREVAVKVIPRARGQGERIEREARAAARLNHPGIIGIYELASDEHDLYLVSELVRGRTLAELIRAGAVSDRDVAHIGFALCEALEHAHGRGVIHRDVKPGNVMVVAEPAVGAGFAKLADFGVAHVRSGADPLTRTGDVVGTLAYMAPEQADGLRVTPACDVYALALTLFEAWTGINPIHAGGAAATARRLGRRLPSLSRLRPDLPLGLCEVIDGALDPDPARRPAAARLRAVLREAEGDLSEEGGLVEPATLRRVGLPETGRRKPLAGRARLVSRAGAGAAGGLLLLAAFAQLGPQPPGSPVAIAAAVALVVALLPRIGWVCAASGLCAWLASSGAEVPGTALVIAVAALPVPLLLPRAGALWSLPVLAPLLAVVALGPAFVGVAALAPTVARRAGLAAAGFLWLALAEVVSGESLLFGVADGTLPRSDWEDSLTTAASGALQPLATGAALAPLLVWAAFAAILPLVVRGRWLAVDLLGGALWAGGLAACHVALGDLLSPTTALDQARGAVSGAVIGALVMISVSQAAVPAEDWQGRPATSS